MFQSRRRRWIISAIVAIALTLVSLIALVRAEPPVSPPKLMLAT